MCYKQELQDKNEEKLQRKFDEENISLFIQKYFINIESKAGAINYWVAIRDLLLWLMEKKIINKSALSDIEAEDFYDVESEDITIYLRSKEQSGMSPTTLKTRKNIFSSFWKYLQRSNKCPVKQNIIESVAYKGISSNNNLVKKLPSDEQIKEMEEKIANKKDNFLRIRNLTVLSLLKGSGIRESELVGLDISDLFLDEEVPYIRVIGKGVYREIEARTVYLTNSAKESIIEWLEERSKLDGTDGLDAVFITKKVKRMTESDVKKLFEHASEKQVTPHMLRHWYATVIAKNGGVVLAQQQLGHSSSQTTINNYANGIYGAKDILASM